MTREKFIELFIEELEIENNDINEKTELNSLEEWNSIGVMIAIGIADEHFNIKLTSADVKELATVEDLMNLLKI